MIRNTRSRVRAGLLAGLITLSSTVFFNCSGDNKENQAEDAAASDTTMGVMGRQGDTTMSSMEGPIQAPPDSASQGPTVPAEVKVTPRQ